MRSLIRRKIEMGGRALRFSKAHPSDDPSYGTMVGRLDELVSDADLVGGQERKSRNAELAASARRSELRQTMQAQFIRHVVRIGELAEREVPELIGRFRNRAQNGTHKAFLIGAKVIYAEALANVELFVRLGLSRAMLDQFAAAIADFERLTGEIDTGRQGHVGARADLLELGLAITKQVDLLNTFNQFRFANDPDLLGQWESARNLFASSPHRDVPPPAVAEELDGEKKEGEPPATKAG